MVLDYNALFRDVRENFSDLRFLFVPGKKIGNEISPKGEVYVTNTLINRTLIIEIHLKKRIRLIKPLEDAIIECMKLSSKSAEQTLNNDVLIDKLSTYFSLFAKSIVPESVNSLAMYKSLDEVMDDTDGAYRNSLAENFLNVLYRFHSCSFDRSLDEKTNKVVEDMIVSKEENMVFVSYQLTSLYCLANIVSLGFLTNSKTSAVTATLIVKMVRDLDSWKHVVNSNARLFLVSFYSMREILTGESVVSLFGIYTVGREDFELSRKQLSDILLQDKSNSAISISEDKMRHYENMLFTRTEKESYSSIRDCIEEVEMSETEKSLLSAFESDSLERFYLSTLPSRIATNIQLDIESSSLLMKIETWAQADTGFRDKIMRKFDEGVVVELIFLFSKNALNIISRILEKDPDLFDELVSEGKISTFTIDSDLLRERGETKGVPQALSLVGRKYLDIEVQKIKAEEEKLGIPARKMWSDYKDDAMIRSIEKWRRIEKYDYLEYMKVMLWYNPEIGMIVHHKKFLDDSTKASSHDYQLDYYENRKSSAGRIY